MPEVRHDPVSGRVVVVSPERGARPHSARPLAADAADAGAPADCPFCPGNEHATPPERHRTGAGGADEPGWSVRVVPNLYPIVGGEHAAKGATGAHEVVVLSPDHFRSFGLVADTQAVEVLGVLRDRTRAHVATGHVSVHPFVNHGKEAGASLAHPHAQIVALDFVPPATTAALARFATAGTDLVAHQIDDVEAGPFAVAGGPVPVWCPPASSAPYEMRLAHRTPRSAFADATDAEVDAVARSLHDALARLGAVAGDVPYNVVVMSAPPGTPDGSFHWYAEIRPRLSVAAGFELGTAVDVDTVAPEVAAPALRSATPS